jgi:hypothetical protein
MGGSGLSGGPSSKPARALGKAVVDALLAIQLLAAIEMAIMS